MAVPIWMETMPMLKPMAFCKASALPTISGGQAVADKAENCGESATTVAPQNSSTVISHADVVTKGKIAQQKADPASAVAATRALPKRWLSLPPSMQLNAPMPTTRKAMPDRAGC